MQRSRTSRSGKWVAAAGLFLVLQVAGAGELDEALSLLQAGQAEQAYTLLAPLVADRSGDPEFDYLFGLAALDSGRTSEAVFALERVLAVDPSHARARAEIGRAYFLLGEVDTARQEFQAVNKQGVPPAVAEAMQRYLNAINQRVSGNRKQMRAYIEAALGYDTNVNAGTSDRNIAVPFFGGAILTLNDAGVEQDDGFGAIGAGAAGAWPLSERVDLVGGLNLSSRQMFSESDFTTGALDSYGGLSYTRGNDVFTAALQGEMYFVDNDTFRNAAGVVGGWNRDFNERARASAFVQMVRLDYPGQDIRDANRYVGGVGASYAFDYPRSPVGYLSLYGGTEDERASGVPHLGHDLYGFRAGGEMALFEKTQGFVGLNLEFREYGGPEPFFLETRDDTRLEFRAGASYRPAAEWSVTPQVSYVTNDSDVALYDYDRIIAAVIVRKEFN